MQKNPDYVLEYTAASRDDVREIVLWYRNEKEGLEDRFLLSLEAAFNSIKGNPQVYQINFDGVRSLLLKRFPYRAYYFLDTNRIIILGVLHAKRSPRLIRKRVK